MKLEVKDLCEVIKDKIQELRERQYEVLILDAKIQQKRFDEIEQKQKLLEDLLDALCY